MDVNLKFDLKSLVVEILDSGDIEFLPLYRTIRKWEASEQGITFEEVLDGSGNIELPDGTRTPRTMIFVNGWKLGSKNEARIIGGYVTGRDKEYRYVDPIVSEAKFRITLLSNTQEETQFVPTEAQKGYALQQGEYTSKDWEVIVEPYPRIKRKENSSQDKHTVFGLYWFLKQEWLRNPEVRKLTFPIQGDNQIPREGIVRHYKLSKPWSIPDSDLEFLQGGPLLFNNKIIVKAPKKEILKESKEVQHKRFSLLSSIKNLFSKTKEVPAITSSNRYSVTVGIVTALSKEFAMMSEHLDNRTEYVGGEGRLRIAITIGEIPAFGSGAHKIALVQSDMGNNLSAITANQIQNDFPNLQEIIMVGIAGAVPNISNSEQHVRLGDIVISGKDGVVQYDMIKAKNDDREHRHQPRPPSAQLLRSANLLDSENIKGNRPWMDALKKTQSINGSSRPDASKDKLASSDDKNVILDHPVDPSRIEGEPRVFEGAIGAANILLKDAKQRDKLRDEYKLRAIEMEASGISDATHFAGSSYFVVRGTCDYCDDHKNNEWQLYAASIAAAYCRVLLEKTPQYRILIPEANNN